MQTRSVTAGRWLAGAALLLALWLTAQGAVALASDTFARPDGILMNTLHIALPTREARSEAAHGLVIITSPDSEGEPNKRMHRTPR